MATEIIIPQIGFEMSEAILAEWLAEDGAHVKEGDPLYAIEADKSTNEIESPATGTLKIIGRLGETYAVGAVIGIID
ncbi:lipoyl domain-containing protein [Caballeronia sp. LZ001]|uniref:lipoyl domain-containing protein n=1 Tax=Caballeronia sp. LZ001 TaxID=3038553 RepID=UPI002862D454|nr:lipoyl domain-containing protein [Caballeronia sp. LZ001]MDR5804835.1 lipoyl domain-containing protein [Caballeronia sp. LZ001]